MKSSVQIALICVRVRSKEQRQSEACLGKSRTTCKVAIPLRTLVESSSSLLQACYDKYDLHELKGGKPGHLYTYLLPVSSRHQPCCYCLFTSFSCLSAKSSVAVGGFRRRGGEDDPRIASMLCSAASGVGYSNDEMNRTRGREHGCGR